MCIRDRHYGGHVEAQNARNEKTRHIERNRTVEDLLKLSNRNLEQTILLITHDEKIALEADRIITIEDGNCLLYTS